MVLLAMVITLAYVLGGYATWVLSTDVNPPEGNGETLTAFVCACFWPFGLPLMGFLLALFSIFD